MFTLATHLNFDDFKCNKMTHYLIKKIFTLAKRGDGLKYGYMMGFGWSYILTKKII